MIGIADRILWIFYQVFVKICSGSWYEDPVRIYSYIKRGSSHENNKISQNPKLTHPAKASIRVQFQFLCIPVLRIFLQLFQDSFRNFSRRSVSNPDKTMPIRTRILTGKYKDLVMLFEDYYLPYSVAFISWESLKEYFRIINLKDPAKVDSESFSGFVQVPAQTFFWIENVGSYQDLLSILLVILTRIKKRSRSRFY